MKKVEKRTPYLSYGVFLAFLTVVVGYIMKPDLLGIRNAFSSLGAFPPTSYVFNTGFVIVAILILLDMLHTKSLLQKLTRLFAGLGFMGLGVFQIEHGQMRGNFHRLSGLVMLLAIITSMIANTITQWSYSSSLRKLLYLKFILLGITSVVMSVLSSAQFKVMALQGLAQYIGLVSLIGWALLDNHENSTALRSRNFFD